MVKVNDKDTRTSRMSLFSTLNIYFTLSSIVNFEHIIADRDLSVFVKENMIKMIF